MRRVYAGIQHGNAHRVKGGEPRLIRHFPHSIEKRRRHVCITDLRIGGGCSEIFGNPRRLKGIVISDRFDVRHFFIAHGFFIRAVYQQHVAAERTSAVHCFEHFQCARTGKFKNQSVIVACRIANGSLGAPDSFCENLHRQDTEQHDNAEQQADQFCGFFTHSFIPFYSIASSRRL